MLRSEIVWSWQKQAEEFRGKKGKNIPNHLLQNCPLSAVEKSSRRVSGRLLNEALNV